MDPAHASAAHSRHLVFDRDNFADFWVALTVRVRRDNYADLVYSGQLPHPLLAYQQAHADLFTANNIPALTAAQIDLDPLGTQQQFLTYAREAADGPFDDTLAALTAEFVTYRQAQRYIYTHCVDCLRVGTSMHYVGKEYVSVFRYFIADFQKRYIIHDFVQYREGLYRA